MKEVALSALQALSMVALRWEYHTLVFAPTTMVMKRLISIARSGGRLRRARRRRRRRQRRGGARSCSTAQRRCSFI